MTLNDVMAVILRYFSEFGKHMRSNTCVPTHNRVDLWRNLCTSLLYFVVRARCRRKESSRSLSHLLMSFLFIADTVGVASDRLTYLVPKTTASVVRPLRVQGHSRSSLSVPVER